MKFWGAICRSSAQADERGDVGGGGVLQRIATHRLLIVLAILLLAFFLRSFPLTFSHYWDETVYLQNAKVISDGRTNYSELDYRPPLLSVFFAAGFRIWDNIYVANLIEGVLTSLVVLFSYLFVRSIWRESSAIIAAVFFAFSPYIVDQSHQLMSDFPSVSLMMASLFLFTKWNKTSLFFSGVLYVMAILTRFTSLFLLVYFILLLIVFQKRIRESIPFFFGALLSILPYLSWARVNYGSFLYPFVQARRIIMEFSPYAPPSVYFHGLIEIFPVIALIGLSTAVGKMVFTMSRLAGRKKTLRERLAILDDPLKHEIVLFLWGVLFFIYMLTITHKETRYIIPLAIPVLTLSAVGFDYLYGAIRGKTMLTRASVVIFFIVLVTKECYPSFERLRWPLVDNAVYGSVAVAEYLKETAKGADTIYAVTDFPVLAFYSSRKTVSLLPVQRDFSSRWRVYMRDAGYYVYFNTDAGKNLMPQKDFLDKTANFKEIIKIEDATVYRYSPS